MSAAGELLAQDFELQPLLLGSGQLALGFAEVGGDFFETGAVGVSSSPGKDDVCAQAGIDKVADQLK